MINTNILASGTTDLEQQVSSLSINAILIASALLVVLLVLSALIMKNKKNSVLKVPLFIAIAATIILPSLLLVGSTVYVNVTSESKGPVHWHTDYELWVCGVEIEHRDPYKFLSNKIGTSTYHEHDDKRIHLEGVVGEKYYDASFEKFMDVTEGEISEGRLVIATQADFVENDTDGDVQTGDPTNINKFVSLDEDGREIITVEDGMKCTEDSDAAEVQAFLLRYEGDGSYTQTKLAEPERYIMRDESLVPPGDCLIVEFDTPKTSSDRLCQQYGVRDVERCTEFGVSEFNPDLCNLKQEVAQPEQPPEESQEAEAYEEEAAQADEGPCELEDITQSCPSEGGDE